LTNLFAIHPQRFHGGSAGWRQSGDVFRIGAPREMVAPSLCAWMKERNEIASDRIDRLHLDELVSVAPLTGLRQIVGDSRAAKCVWDYVLGRKRLRREALLTATIFAKSASARLNQPP
jgi:hypothetical protein